MGRSTRTIRYAVATALLLTLVACGDSDGDEPAAVPTASTTDSPTSEPSPESPSTSPTDGQVEGGTAEAPTALEPRTDPLDWQPVDGSVEDAVTRNGEWSLSVAEDGSTYQLEKVTAGGSSSGQAGANPGWKISDGLLDEDWAVVVLQDEKEEQPGKATVTNLETGKAFEIDGRSDVPTTNGGTWALGDDRLLHATIDKGAYCLAAVDLESRLSTVEWCAPEQHGFNAGHVTDAGISLLTFDNAETSCRTVASIADGQASPFPGATECKAWEGLLLEDDAAVWSVIPKEQRIEEAHLYARVGDGYFDLGPGTAGSLVSCDDAAYFTRDPQQQGAPAALMRWSPDDGLSVAYESPKGQAFIEQPRCGGDTMTVTARTSSGDEQVSAPVDH
jgi:hypothetical protein